MAGCSPCGAATDSVPTRTRAPWNDCDTLPVLVVQAHLHTPVGCVLADAEFDSDRNHTFCRQQLKAESVIPAKRRSSCKASGVRLEMREHFPTEEYAKRSLIESVFSAVKRELSCRAPGRIVRTQSHQALRLSDSCCLLGKVGERPIVVDLGQFEMFERVQGVQGGCQRTAGQNDAPTPRS
jgi:hypothetical protein